MFSMWPCAVENVALRYLSASAVASQSIGAWQLVGSPPPVSTPGGE